MLNDRGVPAACRRGWVRGLLVLAVVAGLGAPVRAANLDPALLREARKVHRWLHAKGYRTVGVLPFRVKKGDRPATFLAGPITTNLPDRLENALVMVTSADERLALRVVRGAGATASRAGVGSWYSNPARRAKLFEVNGYRLAWGDRTVKPDVFLTGLVTSGGDRAKTAVRIEAFGKSSKTLTKVTEFAVATDRGLLVDLGYNFALTRRGVARSRGAAERDRQAVRVAARRDAGQATDDPAEAATPADVAGISFKILYNGKEQAVRPVGQGTRGEFYVNPVAPGTKVVMVLAHNGRRDERLGVILKVDGKSTWREEEQESLECRKWLYDPGDKPDPVRGFYHDLKGKNLRPFRVLSAAESEAKAAELGEKAGYITVEVFGQGPEGGGDAEKKISTRGLSRRELRARPARTLAELQRRLYKANRVKVLAAARDAGGGGLLGFDPEATAGGGITTASLPDAVRLGGITVKYYDAKKTPMSISE
jgi:hypothetical protein